jgi:hypothetical protein
MITFNETEKLSELAKKLIELEKNGKDSYDITMAQRDIVEYVKKLFINS